MQDRLFTLAAARACYRGGSSVEIDPATQTTEGNYNLISGLVVPRPIAWITTVSADAVVNLAPFSAYAMAGHNPPMLMISIGTRDDAAKDTYRNIVENGEFVVNVARFSDAADVQASSHAFAPEESEVGFLGLSLRSSTAIAVPRLAHVPAAMECRLRDRIAYADVDNVIIVADIVRFHISDHLLSNGKIETEKLDPLVRIAGPNYAGLDLARLIRSEAGGA